MGLLQGVAILWVTDWQDGPVEGMASWDGREAWFRAVFDPELDEYVEPRRCTLYSLSDDELAHQWARHRSWEEHAGGCCCYHEWSPAPALRSGWWRYFGLHPEDRGRSVPTGAELGEFVAADVERRLPVSIPMPVPDRDVATRAARI